MYFKNINNLYKKECEEAIQVLGIKGVGPLASTIQMREAIKRTCGSASNINGYLAGIQRAPSFEYQWGAIEITYGGETQALEMWGSQVRLANPTFSSKQLWAFDNEGVLVCKAGHDDDGSRILNAGPFRVNKAVLGMEYRPDSAKIFGGKAYTKFQFKGGCMQARVPTGAVFFSTNKDCALDLDANGGLCMMECRAGKQTQKWHFNKYASAPKPPPVKMSGLKRTYSELFGDFEDIPYNAECRKQIRDLPLQQVNASNNSKMERLFKKLDKNKNGVIDGRDFDHNVQGVDPAHTKSKRLEAHAKWEEIRNYMDNDCNGSVDLQEFKRGVVRMASEAMPQYQVQAGTAAQIIKDLELRINTQLTSTINGLMGHYGYYAM